LAAGSRSGDAVNGGGAVLTPFGLSLVARHCKIERAAMECGQIRFRR
jgi:molybdenum-dependent DNA-binding transcriptional regulator ModE